MSGFPRPLQRAYVAVQERKVKMGSPSLEEVLIDGAPPMLGSEGAAMLVGTNLTMGDVDAFVIGYFNSLMAVVATGLEPAAATRGYMVEALLIGIEYGRELERGDHA